MHRLSNQDFQRAYRYALSLSGDRQLAYDLVHSAVAAALQSPEISREPMRYLLKSVRHRFIDDTRRARRLEWTPLEEVEGAIAADLQPLEAALVNEEALRHAWEQLSAAEREVLFLWAVEGYTIDEISRHTQTPRGTLLARLHRLRRRLGANSPTQASGASS